MSTGYMVVVGIIAVASLIASAILANKAKHSMSTNTVEPTLADFAKTQQSEGVVLPILYGQSLMCGNLLHWRVRLIKDADHYDYMLWLAFCCGEVNAEWFYEKSFPLDNPNREYSRQKQYSVYVDDEPRFFGTPWYPDIGHHKVPEHVLQTGNKLYDPSRIMDLPSGTTPPLKGITTMTIGITDYYNTGLGAVGQITFDNFEHLDAGAISLPDIKCFLTRKITSSEVTNSELLGYANISQISPSYFEFGQNPAIVYYDLLCNKLYGGDISSTRINIPNFISAAQYFEGKKYGLNIVINQKITIKEIIQKIQYWTNSILTRDNDNLYIIKLLLETDESVCVITDKDIVELTVRRKSWNDTYNSFTGNYFPKTISDYKLYQVPFLPNLPDYIYWWENLNRNDSQVAVTIKDEANIQLTGIVRDKQVDLSAFNNEVPAKTRLAEIMRQESYPFITATLTTTLKYAHLKIADVITVQSDEYSATISFRVLSIDYKQVTSNQLVFTLLEKTGTTSESETVAGGYIDPSIITPET